MLSLDLSSLVKVPLDLITADLTFETSQDAAIPLINVLFATKVFTLLFQTNCLSPFYGVTYAFVGQLPVFKSQNY